ncbi:hypothetical protein GCM10010174_63230 [Kutzneria viridogrisea]|uniref:Uncharacterized protein n=2 Tax=Kutzneria TaxID=43356 RepID=W5WIZ4_9PSEU|nr:hypothetical protein [Kutzneria albida]AHI00587.1 hypothetical protein KALB_7229 [Kutzneria albida DSM 43870]MBA8925767.1 hypothetical protein [Kutzneria viridogrisea]
MMWLFTQVFLLCLVSFLAGSALTAVALLVPVRRARSAAQEREESSVPKVPVVVGPDGVEVEPTKSADTKPEPVEA